MTRRGLLLFPPTSERSINLHERQQFTELRLRKTELGGKEPGVAVEHFQVTCGAPLISQIREPARILGGAIQQLQLLAKLTTFSIRDQRIRHVPKRLVDRLLI